MGSFCDITFKRNKDSIEVTNKNGYPSKLYPKIVEVVKPQANIVYQNGKPFFDTLIEQGKLMNNSPDELSLGLYSLAYNTDKTERYWIDNINELLPEGSMEIPNTKSSDVLQDLVTNGMTKDIRLTAKRLLDSVSKNNVPILDKRDMKNGELQYNLFKNEIYVNAEQIKSVNPEDYQRGILHEIIHALTINPLVSREKELKNSEFYKDIKKTVLELEKRVPDKEKGDYKFYAFQHADEDVKVFEFIAEYLSKKEFADWVDSRLVNKKSFIEKLVAFIANTIFGKRILESAIFDYIENRFQYIPMSKNEYREVLMNEVSSFVDTDFTKSRINKLIGNLKNPSFNEQKEYYLAKNTKKLLEDIVKFTTDDDTRLLSESLLQIPNIEDINLYVTKYNKNTKDKGLIENSPDALGTYTEFTNSISIIGTLNKETFETVFLHEMVHAVTIKEYRANKEFSKKINTLYNYALKFKDYRTSRGVTLGEMYGMTNPFEFMSEAMSNPNFIFELSKYYSPFQEKLKEKNLFQEFVNLIIGIIKNKIESKDKKYITDNLGTTILNTISNYANLDLLKYQSLDYNNYIKANLEFSNTDSIKSDFKKIIAKFGKKFGKNQTIIDPNADYGSLMKAVAEINSSYSPKVIEVYKAPDGTDRLRLIKDNLEKAVYKAKEEQKKENIQSNNMEIQKEDTSRMVDSIPELEFLSEEDKTEAEKLLQSGKFNIYCGL